MSFCAYFNLKKTIFFLFLLYPVICGTQPAFAGTQTLMVNPVRAIFTDRQRTVTLSVGNPTDSPISYAISLATMRHDENGKLHEVLPGQETELELLSRKLIRFSPRRATIEPRKRQVVKLMVRKPKDLPFGEYQTRIRITPIKRPETQEKPSQGISAPRIELELLAGVSLPIIIQHGNSDTEVSPQKLTFKRSKQAPSGIAANLLLSRKGSFSAFGDVVLTYTSEKNGKQKKIGTAKGVAIYLPKTEKSVSVLLKNITEKELTSGTIRADYFVYQGQTKRRKRRQPIISKEFTLQ